MSELGQVIRRLRDQPLHTGAAMLAFGLAIAANATIFSTADALLFHPMDLPQIDRLVTIHGGAEGSKFGDIEVAPADYFDLLEQSKTLQGIAATRYASVNLTGVGEPERLQSVDVTPNFLNVLGVKPLYGASFHPTGDRAEVMLSYNYWQRRFGGSIGVLGSTVRLNGNPHTVIAIAPRELRYPAMADVWRSLALTPQSRADRADFGWGVFARLHPNVTQREAASEIRAFGRRLSHQYPDTHSKRGATLFPFRDMISGAFTADFVRVALWAMTLLIAIACANVANLQFARISARAREFSMRRVLGGTRWRIASGVLLESLLLGLGGLACGALIAVWFIDAVKGSIPAEVAVFLPGWRQMSLNQYVLLYAGGLAVLSSLLAGLWPAWRAGKSDFLQETTRAVNTRERSRLRTSLVILQVALSLVLLVGGLVIVKGTASLASDVSRFDASGTLTARVNLKPADRYSTPEAREQFFMQVLDALRQSPRIAQASSMTHVPYSSNWWTSPFERDGFTGRKSERPIVHVERTDSQGLGMLHVRLRRGRNLLESDTMDTQQVALINQTLAKRLYPGEDPLGRRFRLNEDSGWLSIVGVTDDYLHDWVLRTPVPTVFLPYRQSPVAFATLMLRPRSGAPADLAPELRRIIAAIDPQQPIFAVRSFEKVIRDELVGLWQMAGILCVGGLLSLLLSATGLFSLLSFVVAERTREVGLRMALGAEPGAVLRMMIGQGLKMVGVGLVLGVAGSIALGRLLSGLIFGTESVDPLALAGGSLLLLIVGIAACYLPARKAALVDPMIALRQE